MGGNKLFLTRGGVPLQEGLIARMSRIFSELVFCVGRGESGRAEAFLRPCLGGLSAVFAEDREDGRGPLEGLRQGLAASRREWGFLIGCDMPFPNEAVIRAMWKRTGGADAAAARLDGYPMSLHAFYRKSCLPHIDRVIADGPRTKRGGAKITAFYADVALRVVEEAELALLPGYRDSFAGFNTREELARLMPTRRCTRSSRPLSRSRSA